MEIEKEFGFVRQGKGNKDRIFILSYKIKEKIKELIDKEKLNNDSLLFNSNRNKKYSSRTIQQIIKKATERTKINKKVHPHTLRHSFATHLIENGNSVNEVQTLLGHKSPETTMTYLHLAPPNMIKKPLRFF